MTAVCKCNGGANISNRGKVLHLKPALHRKPRNQQLTDLPAVGRKISNIRALRLQNLVSISLIKSRRSTNCI